MLTSEKVPVSLFSRVDFPTDGNPAVSRQHQCQRRVSNLIFKT